MWKRSTASGRHRPGRLEAREPPNIRSVAKYIRSRLTSRVSHYTKEKKNITVIMSTKAKATLASTVLGTIGIVYFVHYQQVADKAVGLHFTISSSKNRADTQYRPCTKV
jgi:hypothetical protein